MGERVRLHGWLHNLRQLGQINFIILRDGYGLLQAITEDEADLEPLAGLSVGTIIHIEGILVASEQAQQGVELHQPRIQVITPVTEAPPIALHKRTLKAGLPTLLERGVVANRHPQRRAVYKLMNAFR